MSTLLLLLVLPLLLLSPFWGAAIGAAAGLAGSYFGAKKDEKLMNKMKDERRWAIERQIRAWKTAYNRSRGEFESERRNILGREQSGFGGVTGGLASSGLLNTTVGANMARGVRSDTNMALSDLASRQSAAEYGKWMDLASLKGQTPYDNFAPQSQASGWGQLGGQLGFNFGSLFDKQGG